MIANILNKDNEGYSKVKQIVKENVKAILSENKKPILVSFAALIQTIKADPEMLKLIQHIPCANNGEYKNNNNIIKYLESNKDSILGLAKKNYENLVEVLTNNAIDINTNSSSSTLLFS